MAIPPPGPSDLKLSRHKELKLQHGDNPSIYNKLASTFELVAMGVLILPMPEVNITPMGVGMAEQLPHPAACLQIGGALLTLGHRKPRMVPNGRHSWPSRHTSYRNVG